MKQGSKPLETFYDFSSVGLFIAIVILFFHRNRVEDQDLRLYLGAGVVCAVFNQIGNYALDGGGMLYHAIAFVMLAGVVGFLVWIYNLPFTDDTPE